MFAGTDAASRRGAWLKNVGTTAAAPVLKARLQEEEHDDS